MEMTLTEILKDYFAKTPLAQVKKDWEESQEFDKVGPPLDEYMKFLEEKHFPTPITNTINFGDIACMHNSCTKCHGRGVDNEGRACIHLISCNCKRCKPMAY
jgi:hypothetical protein